jgi:Family of unknown function (DUF6459)
MTTAGSAAGRLPRHGQTAPRRSGGARPTTPGLGGVRATTRTRTGRRPPRGPRSGTAPVSGPAPARLGQLAFGFAELFFEVEAGRRPRRHLEPLLTPRLYARLAPFWVRPGAPGRVLRVHAHLVSDDTLEAVVVVRRGERVAALALRLTRVGGAWRVDEASRPEDGVLPEPTVPLPVDEPDSFALVLG